MNGVSAKQILIIIILLGLTGAGYYYSNVYTAPVQRQLGGQISMAKSETATMRQEMSDLQSGYDKFVDIKDDYDFLVNVGFFDEQDRLETQKLIEIIQKQSRVISAKYSIKPLSVVDSSLAESANAQLLLTNTDFVITAVEDADIYNFVFLLTKGFPGHVEVTDFNIKKLTDVTQPLLRQIGSGQVVPLVEATLKIKWSTLKKFPDIVEDKEEEGAL